MSDPKRAAFDAAVRFFGSQAELARRLRVSPQAVSYYKAHGLTAEAAVEIERASGGALRAVDLAPSTDATVARAAE